jgi:hypothetical protein
VTFFTGIRSYVTLRPSFQPFWKRHIFPVMATWASWSLYLECHFSLNCKLTPAVCPRVRKYGAGLSDILEHRFSTDWPASRCDMKSRKSELTSMDSIILKLTARAEK